MRLGALADDTRLHILELVARKGEQRAQDIGVRDAVFPDADQQVSRPAAGAVGRTATLHIHNQYSGVGAHAEQGRVSPPRRNSITT